MTRWHDALPGTATRRTRADYRTLGVSEYASDVEIEQAYLGLIAQYQPERLVGLAAPIRRQAEKKAGEIDAAYDRIRQQRSRDAAGDGSAGSPDATAAPEDRGMAGHLLWVALALIVLVAIMWSPSVRDLLMPAPPPPLAQTPAPDASARSLPAERPPAPVAGQPVVPAVAAPPAPPVAAPPAEPAAPVERLVTLMPRDPPPIPPASRGPAAEAALVEAIRNGQLRPANGSDLSRWTLRWSEANRRGVSKEFLERTASMNTYVIQKDFTIPDGLYGAHSVIFLLDTRVPYPRGDPGHSVVLDLSSGACTGTTCRMLLD